MNRCQFVFAGGTHTCVNCGRTVTAPEFQRVVSECKGGTGPGTELHALLGRFGITDSVDCKCKSRVSYMNKMEADSPGWCAEHEDEIVGWLRESAAERSLPFLDWPARLLIRRAIANARRKDAARAERSSHHDRREEVAPPRDDPQG